MAFLVRLRRAATLSSSILENCYFSSIASYSSHFPLSNPHCPTASPIRNPGFRFPSQTQLSSFHSSISCSLRRSDSDQGSKIPEDEILFEGCDYNHWLITMDFPKDPKPSPEEMVETYVQTLAKVVGSVEEAKKRMYACSTTTYTGFQAEITEEVSEKFKGLPGVVFILPDSYIDPVNKQYGGDKYDNGVITPRPPPIYYGKQGRYGDRNRGYDQPRYERQRSPSPMQGGRDMPPQNWQGNPPNDYQGSAQGYGRNYTPQQNYGPPGQDGRSYGPPGQDGRSYGPPGDIQQGYSPMQQGYGRNNGPPQNYGPPGQDGRSFGQPGQDRSSFGQPGGTQQGYSPPGQDRSSFGQPGGTQQGYSPPGQDRRSFGQPGGTQQGYSPPGQDRRSFGQPGDTQQGYSAPGQDRRSFGQLGDTQQGYSPMQHGNPQRQQGNPQMQQGSPQMQPGNQLYSDGGTNAPQQNYGPYRDEGRD